MASAFDNFLNLFGPSEEEKAALLRQRQQDFTAEQFGQAGTDSFRSAEFDEQGNEINVRERTSGGSGLLADPTDPVRQAQFAAAFGAEGASQPFINSMLAPFVNERERVEAEQVATTASERQQQTATTLANRQKEAAATTAAANLESQRKTRLAAQTKANRDQANKLASSRTARLKPFIESRGQAQKAMTSLSAGTGIGDLAAVKLFEKSIDPASVVRESESRAVGEAPGPIERFKGLVKSISGEGKLSDVARQQMAGLIQDIMASETKFANDIVIDFDDKATRGGIDVRDIREGQLGKDLEGNQRTEFIQSELPKMLQTGGGGSSLQDAAAAELRRRQNANRQRSR